MTAQLESSDNKSIDYKLLRYFFLFGMLSSIYVVIFAFVNGVIFGVISLVILIFLNAYMVIIYRKEPSKNFNLRIIYLLAFYTVNAIVDFIITIPPFETTLTLKMVTDSKNLVNNFIYYSVLIFISQIIWNFFTYYFTVWFNEKFSGKSDKIKLYFYASLVELAGTLLEIIGLILMYFLYFNIEKTGSILPKDTSSYINFVGLFGIGLLLNVLGNILEFIAFYKMSQRLSNLEKGLNKPFPAQTPHSQPYVSPFPTSIPFSSPDNINSGRSEIYCSYCGTKLDINSEFCYNCGNKVIYR